MYFVLYTAGLRISMVRVTYDHFWTKNTIKIIKTVLIHHTEKKNPKHFLNLFPDFLLKIYRRDTVLKRFFMIRKIKVNNFSSYNMAIFMRNNNVIHATRKWAYIKYVRSVLYVYKYVQIRVCTCTPYTYTRITRVFFGKKLLFEYVQLCFWYSLFSFITNNFCSTYN